MTGVVTGLYVAPDKGAPMQALTEVRAVPGKGLEGDRYFSGAGTFTGDPRRDSEVTLMALEDLHAMERETGVTPLARGRAPERRDPGDGSPSTGGSGVQRGGGPPPRDAAVRTLPSPGAPHGRANSRGARASERPTGPGPDGRRGPSGRRDRDRLTRLIGSLARIKTGSSREAALSSQGSTLRIRYPLDTRPISRYITTHGSQAAGPSGHRSAKRDPATRSPGLPARGLAITAADEELAGFTRALGHPIRVAIVRYLLEQGESVCTDLSEVVPLGALHDDAAHQGAQGGGSAVRGTMRPECPVLRESRRPSPASRPRRAPVVFLP